MFVSASFAALSATSAGEGASVVGEGASCFSCSSIAASLASASSNEIAGSLGVAFLPSNLRRPGSSSI